MKRLALIVERFGPMLLALGCALLLVWQRTAITQAYKDDAVDFAALYGAVLDWSAIQTGFLFGIFGYVAGKNDGFVAALKDTPEMALFTGYMKWAIVFGFALTVTSIPLIIFRFSIGSGEDWKYLTFVAWSALAIWGFLAFARVAYIFGIIVRVKDQVRIPG
jgi:hypothetical protein